jgi:5'-nucleotidase
MHERRDRMTTTPRGNRRPAGWRTLLPGGLLIGLLACGADLPAQSPAAGRSLHVRVLSTHDFHGALNPTTYPWSHGRPIGGAPALAGVMDSLEAACACPTIRLDAGDEMQGTIESNLTYGAPVVAMFNHLGLDAAAVGNHELDWGVDTLRARQRQATYPWLAANAFDASDGRRPAWATPFVIIQRGDIRVGVVGYVTVQTQRIAPAAIRAAYEFRPGYAGIRDALDAVWLERPDFVIVLAHAGGECDLQGCAGEMVDLASELPPGSVQLIVGGHTHRPGGGVVNGIPIVRAGSDGRAVGVTDLFRREAGSHAFALDRQTVFADAIADDGSMTALLAPYLRAADARAKKPVAILAEPLSNAATGDRRLGHLIAESIRLAAGADIGMHNPGGTRADLAAGTITYGDVFRVMPFDNAVIRVTVTGEQLRQLVQQTGPLYYYANLRVAFGAPGTPETNVALRFPDGAPVRDDRTYSLAAPDFLADGGDGLTMLATLPHVAVGVTVLDATIEHLRTLPVPVVLPVEPGDSAMHGTVRR